MSNALLDETRSERLPINLPFLQQLRVSPTIRDLLDQERPANETWADFAVLAMLQRVVMARTIHFDLSGAKRLLVTLTGDTQDRRHMAEATIPVNVTGVILSDERQKPVQMNLKTAMVAVPKRGR